jgi:hypothetical protein
MKENGNLWKPHHRLLSFFIMVSSLAEALAQHPVDALRKMVTSARETVQRAQFEVEIAEEALSAAEGLQKKNEHPAVAATSENEQRPDSGLTPAEKRELVFLTLQELGPEPVPPKAITTAIDDESINVYNALGRLKKAGRVEYQDGLYGLPGAFAAAPQSSANGTHPNGQEAGTQLRQPSLQAGP